MCTGEAFQKQHLAFEFRKFHLPPTDSHFCDTRITTLELRLPEVTVGWGYHDSFTTTLSIENNYKISTTKTSK
jgi:hypothetical protein